MCPSLCVSVAVVWFNVRVIGGECFRCVECNFVLKIPPEQPEQKFPYPKRKGEQFLGVVVLGSPAKILCLFWRMQRARVEKKRAENHARQTHTHTKLTSACGERCLGGAKRRCKTDEAREEKLRAKAKQNRGKLELPL